CGLAFVATVVGAFSVSVRTGENGYLIAPKSSQEIADSLRKLIADEASVVQFGLASRRIAEERHESERVCADIFDSFLGK
ncbi:MAG: glycosyltransferase, partial [Pseudomonadota bacterium]